MPHPHTILGSESGELKDKGTNRNVTIFYFLLVSINSGVHRAHGTKTGYMFIMCVDTMNEAVSGLPTYGAHNYLREAHESCLIE